MTERIDTLTWLVLALGAGAIKVFLLPDTELMTILAIAVELVCGAGALRSVNEPRCANDAANNHC